MTTPDEWSNDDALDEFNEDRPYDFDRRESALFHLEKSINDGDLEIVRDIALRLLDLI